MTHHPLLLIFSMCMLLALSLPALGDGGGGVDKDKGELVFVERFDDGMRNWWVEGGKQVRVQDGRLYVNTDPKDPDTGITATIWCKHHFKGDLRVEFDARVLRSSIGANNINFFLDYSNPDGKSLYDTRHLRADADYRYYHVMNGYIFTLVRDRHGNGEKTKSGKAQARFRMRRCPGFNLIDQTYDPMGVHPDKTYHVTIVKKDGVLTYRVDGKQYMKAKDDNPHQHGLLGLRTFRTYMWWDNIEVYTLENTKKD